MDENTLSTDDKIVTLLIALILGPSTWLYTIRKDAWKACVGLGLVSSLWILAIATYIGKTKFLETNPGGDPAGTSREVIGWALIILPAWFITWFWAVIDSLFKFKKSSSVKNARRTKAAAIFISVFFGPWTWLYSYSKDPWKFYLGLAFVYGCGIFGVQFGVPYFGIFWLAGSLLVWIAAILNSALRPSQFYAKYFDEDK